MLALHFIPHARGRVRCRLQRLVAFSLPSLVCLRVATLAHAAAPAPTANPLHEAQPPSTTSLSLTEVLAFAQDHAPALQQARSQLARTQIGKTLASQRAFEDPQLQALVGPRFLATGVATDYQIGISQGIEVAGQRSARRQVADGQQRQVESEVEAATWLIHCDIHDAFHRTLLARERLAAHERLMQFQERLFDIANRRLAAGDISPLAVRIVSGDRAAAKVALLEAQEVLTTTSSELKQIVGWTQPGLLMPRGQLDEARDAPALAELAARAQASHPQTKVVQMRIDHFAAQEKLASTRKWSGFGIMAQLQREGALAGQSNLIAFGGLRFNLPLFVGNRLEQSETRVQSSLAHADATRISHELPQQIERAAARVNHAAARMRIYAQEILPSFEENLRLLERAYELGEIDILQVSLARERFLRSQDDALASYGDYYAAIAELERLLGSELWPDDDHHHEPSHISPPTSATDSTQGRKP